jgi:hypothetical protein
MTGLKTTPLGGFNYVLEISPRDLQYLFVYHLGGVYTEPFDKLRTGPSIRFRYAQFTQVA